MIPCCAWDNKRFLTGSGFGMVLGLQPWRLCTTIGRKGIPGALPLVWMWWVKHQGHFFGDLPPTNHHRSIPPAPSLPTPPFCVIAYFTGAYFSGKLLGPSEQSETYANKHNDCRCNRGNHQGIGCTANHQGIIGSLPMIDLRFHLSPRTLGVTGGSSVRSLCTNPWVSFLPPIPHPPPPKRQHRIPRGPGGPGCSGIPPNRRVPRKRA